MSLPEHFRPLLALAFYTGMRLGEIKDGIEFDAHGNLYLTAVEEDAIKVRRLDGHFEFFARATNFTWPDNIAVSHDGYLIFTTSQVHLMPAHNGGVDKRRPPYNVFRLKLTPETRSTSR